MEVINRGNHVVEIHTPGPKKDNVITDGSVRWVTSKDNYGRRYHFLINANGYYKNRRTKRVCPYMHSQ